MRQLYVAITALLAVTAACRDTPGNGPGLDAQIADASPGDGSAGPGDGASDGPAVGDGIAAARAAANGTGLSLPIRGAIVTYEKPQIGNPANDPAGFTIQAAHPGPALFVAVDPASLTPVPAVGDVVDFTITTRTTVNGEPRAAAITGFHRSATGGDTAALAQDVSAATDLVSAVDSYDSELVTVTGTVTEAFSAAGTGFVRAAIDTAGVTGNPDLQLRVPQPLVDAIDLVATCRVTATRVPLGRFFGAAQIDAFAAPEVVLTGCPAPAAIGAAALSPTSVRLTFSRRIDPTSVMASGAQFTFDHGLTAIAATVSGRTVTVVTTLQGATPYAVSVAGSVTDLQGTAVADTAAMTFPGFAPGSGGQLSVHTTLGIPSPSSTTDPDSYLSVKADYVESYNSSRKVPNWVSWELNSSYLGSTPRQDDYRPDDTLPGTLPQAQLTDYSGSGYDRGHMCPSGDRTLTVPANSQTFYLTNMVPQAANNNQGPWEKLESESRSLATAGGKELFIISGGVFSASSNTVGNGMVVPDQTFKVIVVLDAVGQGPADVTANTRVIAVLMPNENAEISKTAEWRMFRVSVDTIEAMTGYDFLSDVDPAVQAVVEARIDDQ